MRRILTIGMIAATGWIGAACADEPEPDADLEATLEEDAAVDTEVAPPIEETDVAEGAALGVVTAAVGEFVTDGAGRAVYVLEGEPTESSTCYDECTQEWPPVLAADAATGAVPGLNPDMIGTITRTDGTTQLTYAGHALYHYRGDQAPGDTMGHDVTDQWGEWYLLGPDGAPLEGEPAEGEAAGG